MDPELVTSLAPAGVYLTGLIVLAKHIRQLYEKRIDELKDSHEARFDLLEQSARECFEDRAALRTEMSQLRDRLLQRGSAGAHDE